MGSSCGCDWCAAVTVPGSMELLGLMAVLPRSVVDSVSTPRLIFILGHYLCGAATLTSGTKAGAAFAPPWALCGIEETVGPSTRV